MEKFLCWCVLMLLPVTTLLGFLSQRDGSLLQQASSSEAVFRRRTLRIFMLCSCLLLAVGMPYANWLDLQRLHNRQALGLLNSSYNIDLAQSTAHVLTVMDIGLGLGLLCFCLPEELRLNLDKRTYRLTKGWPPLGLTRSGTWDDIAGIYIKDITRARFVCLSYNHPAGRWTLIGIASKNRGAVSLARELATRLSLPLINPPNGR